MITGRVLTGFGAFNLFTGVVNHHLLGIRHINETVPPDQWNWWTLGFLIWGAVMLIVGFLLSPPLLKT